MVRSLSLSAALLLAAASASASFAIPSFELSAAQIHSSIAAMRGAQLQARSSEIGPRLRTLTWEMETAERDAWRLRGDLRYLIARVRMERPERRDPSLGWDLQRYLREYSRLEYESRRRLNDLRFLASQAQRDETLVAPATSLLNAARRLRNETNWLVADSRYAAYELMRARFTFEAMQLDRTSREVDTLTITLEIEAERLLVKVRD